MGKQKLLSEKYLHDMVLPSANDGPGVIQKMLGFDRVRVPGDFQSEERGEKFWRYTQNQVDQPSRDAY